MLAADWFKRVLDQKAGGRFRVMESQTLFTQQMDDGSISGPYIAARHSISPDAVR